MSLRVASWLCLSVAATAVWYAAIVDKGNPLGVPFVSLLLLGLAGLTSAFLGSFPRASTRAERLARYLAFLVPMYVAVQLIPVPFAVLQAIDPTRAEIAQALEGITEVPAFVPVSIAPEKTWHHLARVVAYALVFLIVSGLVVQRGLTHWEVMIPLIALGVLETGVGLNQLSHGANVVAGTYLIRNHFSGLLEIVVPFVLCFGAVLVHRLRTRNVLSPWLLTFACAVFSLAVGMLAAIAFSLSRMGFMAALASVFGMMLLRLHLALPGARRKATALVAVAVATVLAIVLFAPFALVSRYGDLLSETAVVGRWPVARDTLTLFGAYPLVGSGLGTLSPALLRYQRHEFEVAWANVHNDYLEILAGVGIIGFMLFGLLILVACSRAARVAINGPSVEIQYVSLACVGSLTAMLIHSVADFNMFVPANAMALSWVVGLTLALPAETRSSS
jgi:O-antigen ligase